MDTPTSLRADAAELEQAAPTLNNWYAHAARAMARELRATADAIDACAHIPLGARVTFTVPDGWKSGAYTTAEVTGVVVGHDNGGVPLVDAVPRLVIRVGGATYCAHPDDVQVLTTEGTHR